MGPGERTSSKLDFLRLIDAQRQLNAQQEMYYQAITDYHRRLAELRPRGGRRDGMARARRRYPSDVVRSQSVTDNRQRVRAHGGGGNHGTEQDTEEGKQDPAAIGTASTLYTKAKRDSDGCSA